MQSITNTGFSFAATRRPHGLDGLMPHSAMPIEASGINVTCSWLSSSFRRRVIELTPDRILGFATKSQVLR
jgi:hypothetical protein